MFLRDAGWKNVGLWSRKNSRLPHLWCTDIRTSKNPLVLLSYSVGYNRLCYDLKSRETEPQTYLWNVQKQSPRLFITVNWMTCFLFWFGLADNLWTSQYHKQKRGNMFLLPVFLVSAHSMLGLSNLDPSCNIFLECLCRAWLSTCCKCWYCKQLLEKYF